MLARLAYKICFLPYKLFMRIRASDFAFLWLNRRARVLFQKSPLPFLETQKAIVASMKKDGIAFSNLSSLFGRDMMPELVRHAEALESRAFVNRKKSFLMNLFDEEPLLVPYENLFIESALAPTIVRIANAYLGMFSRFYFCSLNITTPVGSGADAVASQKWHRDPEERMLLKMFIYLSDVDEESGPFTYIKGSQRGGRYGALFPQKPPRSSYPEEAEVLARVRKEDIFQCVGKAGSVIFADTAGLHRGGFAKSKKRIMFTAGFYPGSSVWPELMKRPTDLEKSAWFKNAPPDIQFSVREIPPHFGKRLFKKIRNVYR